MQESAQERSAAGLLYGLAAYGCWGVMPVYFQAVMGAVTPPELLAHRIVWSVVLLAVILTLWRRWPHLRRCLAHRRVLALLLASALFVGTNWLIYIHGVATHRVVQTSLGYFINPLLSILLGLLVFRERLRGWQWVAVALAAAGVAWNLWRVGELPWIALSLAGSFAMYGLVRKVAPVDAVLGLTVETLVLLPAALAYLVWDGSHRSHVFARSDTQTCLLILASGVVTTVPLLCFGQAARRLPLSTLGFLQYLAPSMQLVLAIWLFGEDFSVEHAVTFGFIWSGLAILTVESLVVRRRAARLRRRSWETTLGEPIQSLVGYSPLAGPNTKGIGASVDDMPAARPFLPEANS